MSHSIATILGLRMCTLLGAWWSIYRVVSPHPTGYRFFTDIILFSPVRILNGRTIIFTLHMRGFRLRQVKSFAQIHTAVVPELGTEPKPVGLQNLWFSNQAEFGYC